MLERSVCYDCSKQDGCKFVGYTMGGLIIEECDQKVKKEDNGVDLQ